MRCPACNALVFPGDAACPKCRQRLEAKAPLLEPLLEGVKEQREAQRQEISVDIAPKGEPLTSKGMAALIRGQQAGLQQPAAESAANSRVDLEVEISPVLNYLLYNAGYPLHPMVRVSNVGPAVLKGAQVRVGLRPEGYVTIPVSRLDLLEGETVELKELTLALDLRPLQELAESVQGAWDVEVTDGDETVAGTSRPVSIHPLRQWIAVPGTVDSLAGLVTPNDAMVKKFVAGIGLNFTGYQSRDPAEVLRQVVAVFDAIKGGGFRYIGAPPSFDGPGQKVRFPCEVLEDRQGTCLDWCVFVSAVIEYIGLRPLIVLMPGHAFHAVWTQRVKDVGGSFGANALRELVEQGLVVPFNSTSYFESESSFTKARDLGLKFMAEADGLIDLTSCRAKGVKPVALGR